MDCSTILKKQARYLFPGTINYYAEPIPFERGDGVWLTDVAGNRYLDFFGGILTVSLGHCHEPVVARIVEQLRRLQHTSTLYPNEPIVRLAEKVASIAPGRCVRSAFVNSGTEADETAVLCARMHAGGAGDVIALRHCYAGRSMLAVNLTAQAAWRLVPSQVPGIKHAHAPYCYRCPMGLEHPSCDLRCAKDIEELILTETCGRVAGFIAEPILGVGGFIVPPPGYFETAVGIVRKYGGIFISDEVQTGWGRTGASWNGIEHWNVKPDVVTYAKGMANGVPIGACVVTDDVAASLKGLTISTFGGNPVTCVAALATIDVMEREAIPERAARLGARFRAGLDDLGERHACVGEVRGMGLMQALELVEDRGSREPSARKTVALMEECRKEGLLVGKGGLYGNVIRLAPPMLVSDLELDDALARLGRALSRIPN
jgi:4-aminobutyrate aminotransferase-like enzyme